MRLMDILRRAQGGEFFDNAARVAGVDAVAAEQAIGRMGPLIAVELRRRYQDPEALEDLFDLVEDNDGLLDEPHLMDEPELFREGDAVLARVYGSAEAAHSALGVRSNDMAALRLSAISATAMLGVLARSYAGPEPQTLAATGTSEEGGEAKGGLLATIIAAIIKGVLQGVMRQLAPRRRRRTSINFGTGRKRRSRRRRDSGPSLDHILEEILGSRSK